MSEIAKLQYIVVVGVDPSYYIQFKKQGLVILNFQHLGIFIYKPRPIDIPKLLKLEHFDESIDQQVEKYVNSLKLMRNNLIEEDMQWFQMLQVYIIKFCIKNKDLYKKNVDEFEKEFVTKVRNYLVVIHKDMYWQMFVSKKVEVFVMQQSTERFVEFEMDFQSLISGFKPVKLVVFNRKGRDLSIVENLSHKTRELFGFFALLLIFITLVMCREEEVDPNTSHPIRNYICPQKQNILSILGGFFLLMIVQRLYTKFKDKRMKVHQKQQELQQQNGQKKKKQ